jgi:hypothetical protein
MLHGVWPVQTGRGLMMAGDLEYLTDDEELTLGDIFACATAMIGVGIFKGDMRKAQALMERFQNCGGVALVVAE